MVDPARFLQHAVIKVHLVVSWLQFSTDILIYIFLFIFEYLIGVLIFLFIIEYLLYNDGRLQQNLEY